MAGIISFLKESFYLLKGRVTEKEGERELSFIVSPDGYNYQS